MAIKSGFFNSIDGDRRYKADFFAEYFATFIGNGVFPNPSTGLQIIADNAMSVNMKAGKSWINGYYFVNNADYNLQLDIADGVLKRIDRIVLQLNFLNREIIPVVKKGAFSSSPTAPELQRDADAYEIALADIAVDNGAISITQANITDLRLNKDLCGIVHGTVNQVDMTTIFNQYLAWFNETKNKANTDLSDFYEEKQEEFEYWFNNIKGILEGDVAANLAEQIAAVSERVTTLENNSATKEELTSHKNDYVSHIYYAVATGNGSNENPYVVTLPDLSEYFDGMAIAIKVIEENVGNRIDVNGLGQRNIATSKGTFLAAGKFAKDGIYTLRYSEKKGFILQGEGGEYGNATANDVLVGKTIGTENGLVTGNIPNYGRTALGESTYSVAKSYKADGGGALVFEPKRGYYEEGLNSRGFGSVYAKDTNFIAANIKKGTSIFGLSGTLEEQKNYAYVKPGTNNTNFDMVTKQANGNIFGVGSVRNNFTYQCIGQTPGGTQLYSFNKMSDYGNGFKFVGTSLDGTRIFGFSGTTLYEFNTSGTLVQTKNLSHGVPRVGFFLFESPNCFYMISTAASIDTYDKSFNFKASYTPQRTIYMAFSHPSGLWVMLDNGQTALIKEDGRAGDAPNKNNYHQQYFSSAIKFEY